MTATWPLSLMLPEGRFEARLRDISESGVCFHVDRPVPEMTLLQVGFDLPGDGGPVAIRGEGAVVRCEALSPHVAHYEVAVFFNRLEDDAREHLRAYVERQTAESA